MSDNPFAEPDDSERTIIRPAPGGRRAPAAPPPVAEMPETPAAPVAAPSGGGADMPSLGVSPLAAAAAPLLALLGRLRNTVSQPDPGELRERAVREMRQFEQGARAAGVPMEQLRPAHYALCASLDDVVLNTPWGSHGGWAAGSLVSTFHQEVRSGERFFQILGQVKQTPGTFMPVVELMYLCMALGMQGQYRLSPRGPAELDRVREETYALIQRQRPPAEPALSPHWQGAAAPYRPARAVLPVWVAGAGGLAVIAALFLWFSSGLNGASDALFDRMLAAPPDHMPQIVRTVPVKPPPPPPPAAVPDALDKLRTFLKPEIDQKLVEVIGTDAVPIVRIHNTGMFASGSATMQARFLPLLGRIGEALKTEKGKVDVIGYTDNQPIHTVQFPSNFHLSTARAKAAAAAIDAKLGAPGRITAEGRADADPVASNATPQGREANRRIEVVLHRQP